MFMAAWMTRDEVVSEYQLLADESAFVFSQLKNVAGKHQQPRYLEADVDRVIASLRRNRPPSPGLLCVGEEEKRHVFEVNSLLDVLGRIATSFERMADAMVPQEQAAPLLDTDPCLRTGDAAKCLDLDKWTVRKYCRDGVFGTRLSNGHWVIRRSEIEHYLKGQQMVHGRGVA